jgi:hypothetical protein
MPDDTTDQVQPAASRRTGAQHLFLNRARLIARQKVAKVKADRSATLAEAHAGASAQLFVSRGAANEKLTGTITKYYAGLGGRNGGPAVWLELDTAGTVVQKISGLGEDAVFDEASNRIYYSSPEDGWRLYSSDLSGRDVKWIGVRGIHNLQQGAIAFDLVERAVFWIGGDGVIARTSLDDGDPAAATRILKPIDPALLPNQQYPYPASIAVDAGRRQIYYGYGGAVGTIDYDGNGDRTMRSFGPPFATMVDNLFVDPERQFLYFNAVGCWWRMRTDDSEVRRFDPMAETWGNLTWGNFWFDPATQLILSCVGANTQLRGVVEPSFLHVGSLGQDVSRDGFVPMLRKRDFTLPSLPGLSIDRFVAVTSGSVAAAKVADAAHHLHDVHAAGLSQVAAAHADAQQQRDASDAKLAAAHADAADEVAGERQQAAATRSAAQDAARERQALAAQHLSDARVQADRRRQDASEQAQALEVQKRQEAAAIQAPAQGQLDAARRRLQNS